MTEWMTEEDAAKYLMIDDPNKLKYARYRHKVRHAKFCGIVQYKKEWLDEFREGSAWQSEKNTTSENSHGRHSSMSAGQKKESQSASARAKQIAKKLRSGKQNLYLSLIEKKELARI